MQNYSFINAIYQSKYVRFIRFVVLILLLFLCLYPLLTDELHSIVGIKYPLFLYLLFFMIEVFFEQKIRKIMPSVFISSQSGKNILDSFTLEAGSVFVEKGVISGVKKLLHSQSVQFILQRGAFLKKEILLVEVPLEKLFEEAFNIAKELNGRFVTAADIFSAYLLLIEQEHKVLFNKKLKREDLLRILEWARMIFSDEENPKPARVHFWGEGIGEALVSGWTFETKKYTSNFTYTALQKPSVLFGYEKEYVRMLEGLSRRENNNILLVGESGSGKDTLVEIFAANSFLGKAGGALNYRHVYELLLGALFAGNTENNSLASRIEAIIEEISHSGNGILFIPEFQNILEVNSSVANIAGVLMPYLRDGKLPIISTMTMNSYKQYLEQNPLREVFEVIKLESLDKDTVYKILFQEVPYIESKNNTLISLRAVDGAIEYASSYLQEKILPGSAIELLNDVAHSVAVSDSPSFDFYHKKIVLENHVITKVEEKTKIPLEAPKEEEKDLLLHLENKIHERFIDQEEAVKSIAESMRRLRSGLSSRTKPMSFLFLGPTGSGKTEMAKTIAALYFGSEDKMLRFDMSEYATDDGVKRLLGASPGEGSERGELTEKIYEHQFSLVLLDEFEKAHKHILDLFLQVFDDGRLTDNKGKTVSFVNTIIIATSNAASEFIREEMSKGVEVNKEFQTRLIDFLQTKGLFTPELLNRFDAVIVFKPLGQKEVMGIIKLLLKKVAKKLQDQDISITFDETVLTKIAQEGFDKNFGARPLNRFIQDNIEDLFAQKILKEELKRGDNINLSINSVGEFQLTESVR